MKPGRLRRPHDRAQRQVAARRAANCRSTASIASMQSGIVERGAHVVAAEYAHAHEAAPRLGGKSAESSSRSRGVEVQLERGAAPARGASARRGPTTTGLTSGCASSQASASVGHVDAALARPSPRGASSASNTLGALQVLVGLGAQRHARAGGRRLRRGGTCRSASRPTSGENGEKPRPCSAHSGSTSASGERSSRL